MRHTVSEATSDHLEAIVEGTRKDRRDRAEWAPVYFRMHPLADERHAQWLGIMVASQDFTTNVVTIDGAPALFFATLALPATSWIDDLALLGTTTWSDVTGIGREWPHPWATCVHVSDTSRRALLSGEGGRVLSVFMTRPLTEADANIVTNPEVRFGAEHLPSTYNSEAPPHTFGGGNPFDPNGEGALALSLVDDDQAAEPEGSYVIVSMGVEPPIYDPGGPAAVADQLRGPRRLELLDQAIRACRHRGDALLIVVADIDDTELVAGAEALGFKQEVLFVGTMPT